MRRNTNLIQAFSTLAKKIGEKQLAAKQTVRFMYSSTSNQAQSRKFFFVIIIKGGVGTIILSTLAQLFCYKWGGDNCQTVMPRMMKNRPVLPNPRVISGCDNAIGENFIERRDTLKEISDRFYQSSDDDSGKIVTIVGTPGCGKSELAKEYARHLKEELEKKPDSAFFIYFLNAENPVLFAEKIKGLRRQFGISESDSDKVATETIYKMLQHYDRFLLIFDNVNDINLITPYIRSLKNGQFIITSRDIYESPTGQLTETIENMKINRFDITLKFRQKEAILLGNKILNKNNRVKITDTEAAARTVLVGYLANLLLPVYKAFCHIEMLIHLQPEIFNVAVYTREFSALYKQQFGTEPSYDAQKNLETLNPDAIMEEQTKIHDTVQLLAFKTFEQDKIAYDLIRGISFIGNIISSDFIKAHIFYLEKKHTRKALDKTDLDIKFREVTEKLAKIGILTYLTDQNQIFLHRKTQESAIYIMSDESQKRKNRFLHFLHPVDHNYIIAEYKNEMAVILIEEGKRILKKLHELRAEERTEEIENRQAYQLELLHELRTHMLSIVHDLKDKHSVPLKPENKHEIDAVLGGAVTINLSPSFQKPRL